MIFISITGTDIINITIVTINTMYMISPPGVKIAAGCWRLPADFGPCRRLLFLASQQL